ncbi:MAG: OPT/YSL family transporter, partial [Methyloceanibacter sp.]
PSGASLGLAFVIPASTSMTLFLGALAAAFLNRVAPNWSARFLLSLAAGLVAGESLYGVIAVWI